MNKDPMENQPEMSMDLEEKLKRFLLIEHDSCSTSIILNVGT